MRPVVIRLAPDVELRPDSSEVLSDGLRLIVAGESGSGKSSAAALIAGRLLEERRQVVLLDSHGEYAPLAAISKRVRLVGYRSQASEGLYSTEGSVRQYLRMIESGDSVLFNLSEWTDLDQRSLDEFVAGGQRPDAGSPAPTSGFLAALYTLRRRTPKETFLLMEEAQNFVPSQPLAGEHVKIRRVLGILTGGRKFGIQVAMCTQSPALVNLRARMAANMRMFLRTTGWADWKDGVKPYIPESLGVVWDDKQEGWKPESRPISIRKFPAGFSIVLSRWHGERAVQLYRPGVEPDRTVPGVLT